MKFENLKIIAFMNSPLVINYDLMLDAILISKKAIELKLDSESMDFENALEIKDIVQYLGDIPLCSKAIFEGIDSKAVYYKRFDEDGEFTDNKKIKIGSGKYKNYCNTLKVTDSEKVTFYCIGDKKQIQTLLNQCYSLGKKQSQGYGIVKKWEIETIKNEINFLDIDNPLRPLPIDLFLTDQIKFKKNIKLVTYKFPYYYNGNKKKCYV